MFAYSFLKPLKTKSPVSSKRGFDSLCIVTDIKDLHKIRSTAVKEFSEFKAIIFGKFHWHLLACQQTGNFGWCTFIKFKSVLTFNCCFVVNSWPLIRLWPRWYNFKFIYFVTKFSWIGIYFLSNKFAEAISILLRDHNSQGSKNRSRVSVPTTHLVSVASVWILYKKRH